MALVGLHYLYASLMPPPVSISLRSGVASQEPSLIDLHAKLRPNVPVSRATPPAADADSERLRGCSRTLWLCLFG